MKTTYIGDERITITGTQPELKALWKCFRRKAQKDGAFWTPFEFPKMIDGLRYRLSIEYQWGYYICHVNRFKPVRREVSL